MSDAPRSAYNAMEALLRVVNPDAPPEWGSGIGIAVVYDEFGNIVVPLHHERLVIWMDGALKEAGTERSGRQSWFRTLGAATLLPKAAHSESDGKV